MHSLQFRVLLVLTLAILVAITATFAFVGLSARGEISRFEDRAQEIQRGRVERALAAFYHERGGWSGVQSFVERMGSLRSQRLVLTDAGGTVVADSQGELLGQRRPGLPGRASPLPGPHDAVGTVYVGPVPDTELTSAQRLFRPIFSLLLWGSLVAVAIALVVTFFLSRRVLAPVKALASTARQLGKGDFSRRVEFRGRGEVGELAAAFNSMAGDLERAEELKRNMVADVAHELRTPLSNVRGYLEALSDGVLEPNPNVLRSIDEEAKLLSRLVDDLQELSLAEAGEMALDTQPTDIPRAIRAAVAAVGAQAAARGLAVRLDVAENLPAASADPDRLAQVLRILLENAMAHTEPGGSVTVGSRAEVGSIAVSVTDTGEGIPPQELSSIFERFYRVDKSRARSTGGSGLGLTIARRLVEAQGGAIKAHSQPGKGSRFAFTIPAAG